MTADSCTNRAIALPHQDVSGYVGRDYI